MDNHFIYQSKTRKQIIFYILLLLKTSIDFNYNFEFGDFCTNMLSFKIVFLFKKYIFNICSKTSLLLAISGSQAWLGKQGTSVINFTSNQMSSGTVVGP